MLRFLRLVLINFAVLVTTVALLALAFEAYLFISRKDLSETDRRRAETPNYANAEWALTHFREMNELKTLYFPFVEWRRELFEGETVNVVGPFHERLTPQAEGAKGGAVYFFGGSTMWGTGSRDHETIPSYYGRIAARPTRNFGESGYTTHQSLEMLLWLLQEGERPEAVVFYSGVNDVVNKCQVGLTDFSHGLEPRMRALLVQRHGLLARLWVPIEARLAELLEDRSAADSYDCDTDPRKARAVAEALVRDWQLARTIAEAEGIRFFAVLQPVAYYSASVTDQRADLGRMDDERRRQFESVYPLLQERLGEIGAIDLTAALDEPVLFYIDFCHLSPNGNEQVAQALAQVIEPQLSAR